MENTSFINQILNANITNFIDNSTSVISDPEGWSININESKKYIICGDMLDSTYAPPVPPDRFLDKCFNISNIRNVVDNPTRFKLMFGNRDLNKIICGFLCHIESDTDNANKFNSGEIDLTYESYVKLKSDISSIITGYDNGWNGNMRSWYTFWAGTLGNEKNKNWEVGSKYDKENFFYNRFIEIFGPDNAIGGGTISAQNLLYTIPLELGFAQKSSLVLIINALISKIKIDVNIESLKENDNTESLKAFSNNLLKDYFAFIVLAVFKSMCIKKSINTYMIIILLNTKDYCTIYTQHKILIL